MQLYSPSKLHGGCLANITRVFDIKNQLNLSFLYYHILKIAVF